jgi:hypothetical protein
MRKVCFFRFEGIALITVSIVSTFASYLTSDSRKVFGGGCVSSSSDHPCSEIANNGSSCSGNYTKFNHSDTGNYTDTVERNLAWCAACESTVNKRKLTEGCAAVATDAIDTSELP